MPKLTLTFDNGPLTGATADILDILESWGVKATFFLVGEQLEDPAQRKLAEETHAAGHWIGNHTMHHPGPLGLLGDPERAVREIDECNRMIGELHHPDRFFRPNGRKGFGPHCLDRASYDYCVDFKHTIVTCTNIPLDGVEPYELWADRILDACAKDEWTVTILHDKHLIHNMHNLPIFLERATDAGIEFVQEFPEVATPMVRGQARHPLETFVTLEAV